MNTKSNLLKSFFISLILILGVSNAWGDKLYLKPNSNWTQSNARFAAYFFGNGEKWISMTAVSGETNLYEVTIPTDKTYPSIIFCRMNPSAAANNWNNKWNQTGDLTIPKDGKNLFTIPSGSWDGATTTWSTYEQKFTVTISAEANGSVSPNGDQQIGASGIDVTATPTSGYKFSNWTVTGGASVNSTTDAKTKVTATAAGTVTAHFEQKPPKTVYLKPNSDWKQASARFAIYCWEGSNSEWFDMTKIDCDGDYYVAEIPGAYSDCKFVRLNPATTENNWNNGTKWNETGDLKVPTDDKVLFTVDKTNDWNGATTTWSTMSTYPTYIITLDRQDGTTGSTSVTATYGSDAPSITTPTRANYTFEGYYTQQNGQGDLYIDKNGAWQNIEYIADGKWMKPACNLTLYAKWTISAAQYTVTLNAQDGEGGSPSVQAYVGFAMPEITLPTRTGYTFNGYFTATSGGTKYYNADGSSAKNWDKTVATTLYAQWTANKYTVTFHANGGEGSMSDQSFIYDEASKALTANTFTRKGYEFTGWNTKDDGTGTAYTDKQSVSNLSSTNGATVTLYAQWNQLSPTTVYINPETNWEETLKIICDEEEDMTPVGCDGYYTAEVPGGTTELKFGGNGEQTLSLTVPTDDKVLYDMTSTNITHLYLKPNSNWTQANARFAAYFFGNGEKWVSMTDEDSDGVYEVNIPTEKTYPNVIFCRMNPKHSDNRWNNDQDTEDTKRLWNQTADLTIPTDGTNCYAVKDGTWDKGGGSWHKVWDNSCWTDYSGPSNTYTVTLDRQGATTGSESVTATFGEKPATIDMPEREGYTFNGYYTAASEGTQIINAEGEWMISTNYVDADGNWISTDCNITFYAQWTSRTFTITLQHSTIEGYGSGGTSSVTATYGDDMPNIPELPTAENGYAFMGYWDGENGTGTQYYNADGTSAKNWDKTSNTTLYAYFQKAEITGIAFDKGEVPEGGYVTFEPTIEPTPSGNTVICWELKKGETTIDNSYIIPVEETNNVKISIAELVADKGKGIYTIKATLRTGTGCESGTELSSYETNFANTDFILSTPIYLKPSATWQQHNARFAVYYWGNGENNNGWVDMNTIGCSDEYYAAEIPIGYSDFKFVRLDPDKTGNNWDNRWCETGDLTIPADGKNLFDMTQIYLNAQQGWTNDGARFAAYFYVKDDDSKTKWMSMSHVKDNIYKCDIPDDYNFDWVIFGRMNGSTSTNNWDNKWNQTNDLELTTDNVTHGNYYTIIDMGSNGEKSSGSWSWDDIAWSKLDLPTITITNNNPTCGSISVKTIDGTEITSGMEVDWDTEVIVSIQPEAGYAVESSSIYIGGTTETIQPGKTYTICGNTTINISFEEKSEYYIIGIDGNWDSFQEKYKFIDGKVLLSLKKDGGNPSFKIAKVKGGTLKTRYGRNNTYTFKGNINTTTLSDANSENDHCILETVHDGDYLFVWDENTKTLTIEYPNVIFLHGGFNGWKDKASHALHDRDAIVYLTAGSDYEFKVAEKGIYYTAIDYTTKMTKTGDSKTMDDDNNYNTNPYHYCTVNASVTGLYTFHFDKETRILTITYPTDNTLAVGDYRLHYTNDSKNYYTDHVKKRTSGDGVDTVSLFILNAGTEPRVILQRCTNASGNGTWEAVNTYNLSSMTLDDEMTDEHGGVWNFIISQTNKGANATVSNATTPERYTGKYYIRTDAADGGWNEYMIPENEIFFSSYARDNEGFDYYYCKYIGSGTNVKYNIANDYNSKLNPADHTYGTGDLIQSETLPADGNVRFMWNSRTNELVGRAYLDGSSTENFLRITNATNLYDADGKTINEIKFTDLQNWIYQVDVQANTNTQIKLKAIYNGNEQFFKGDNDNTVSLLTSNNTSKNYKIRLIYNFKTNHLVCAWLGGDETITTDEKLTADMMIIRRNQEQAEQLSFNPNTKQLDLVGTAYAVMTFTKAFIQNETYKERQRSLYWVSFPFDVKISDVFGFGEYGEHWILQYYDGAERAKKGLFIDSGTYWKYITNTETILKKGVGYVLALDLNKVQFLHGVEDVSLYFPSTGKIGIIKGDGETTTMEVPAHQCTITHGQMDRRIYDSHWNLIGIPGFTDPGMIDVTNYNNKIPEVFLKEDANLGFHYEFDLATNTYNVKRSTVAFKTMYSYLVQYYGTMEWNISAIDNTPAQIAARRNSNSNVPEKVSLRLEIAQNEQMIDQTFVQLQQEKATAEFDMNLDLTKIINSGANIYTLAGTNRIQTAGNTLPMNNATVPVGVVISKAGEYTFRMPDGTDGILVEFIDYETNTTTNLLYDEYTVNLTKGTFENRFALFVRPNNTATSLENINGESTTNSQDSVRKVLIDNILYIVRDGQIFDARGARVK